MKEVVPVLERARAKLLTNGAGKAAFLKGYQVGTKDLIELIKELCEDDIEVSYPNVIPLPRLYEILSKLDQ